MNILKFVFDCATQRHLRQQIAAQRNKLYRMVYAWGQNPDLAHDIAQECMLKALHNLKQLRDPTALNSWLFGILINCWRDHFRRQRETVNIDDITLADPHTPELIQHRQDMIDLVRQMVAELPEGQRLVITLVDLEGFSYLQVSEILAIPVGTVMSRLSRARLGLADKLTPQSTVDRTQPRIRSIS